MKGDQQNGLLFTSKIREGKPKACKENIKVIGRP